MPLIKKQMEDLEASINGYSFPQVYWDFDSQSEVKVESMVVLEDVIRNMLISPDCETVKKGLANIVYWGNANAGYQMHRVDKYMKDINKSKIQEFQSLVTNARVPALKEIVKLKMPQYSGVSFISKIIAFLDPNNFCVLDLLLSRLQNTQGTKAIHQLKVNTQIGVTKNNGRAYIMWCKECIDMSNIYYRRKYRAVDIERGYFNLIQNNQLAYAQEIYNAA